MSGLHSKHLLQEPQRDSSAGRHFTTTIFLVALSYLVWLAAFTARSTELLPIEDFCRAPGLSHVLLSPDGKHMAALTADKDKEYIVVSDLITGTFMKLVVPPLIGFQWLTERRLLCEAAGARFGEIFAINIDGSELALLQNCFFNQAFTGHEIHSVSLLKLLPNSTNSILVQEAWITRWNLGKYPSPNVQRLNFFTGEMTMEEQNPGKVVGWLADSDGIVRAALKVDKDSVQLLYRASKAEPWSVVHTSTREELDFVPHHFAPGNKLWVYSHAGMDTLGLYTFDPATKQIGDCVICDPQFDISNVIFTRSGRPVGAYYNAERLRFRPVDEQYAKIQQKVDAILPDAVNIPISWTGDGRKVLYRSFSDRDPGSYYLVDAEKNELGIVGRAAMWIKSEQMASMKPIQFKARDGLTIHGYLTVPPGVPATNLPMVVMPHGGPAARDTWKYEPDVQFLANRGYAVLQVNFRGSTGYGLKFRRAGFKEWGGRMQDDITDGVNWAIEQGIADKARIAMFGASYGGYAALMGLIATPELFQCGICYAGVTDVRSITRRSWLPRTSRSDFERVTREEIGDYREDKLHLQEISPVNQADKIQAPILLAYGARDPIVDIEQGKAFAKALKKNKKDYEMIIEKDEGHGFVTEPARSNLLFNIEKFLSKNLKTPQPR